MPYADASPAQAALATFARWHNAHQARDSSALADTLAADVVIHSLFRPEPVTGRDEALAHFASTTSVYPDLSLELRSPAATPDGSVVLAEVTFTGHFTGALNRDGVLRQGRGEPFAVPGVVVVHVEQGLVRSVRTMFDRDLWLAQIGANSHLPDDRPAPD